MPKPIDESETGKVAPTDGEIPNPVETGVKPKELIEPLVEKLQLSQEELDARIANAVAEAERVKEDSVRAEEARKNGDYKLLMETAQKEALEAKRELWVERALNKNKLSEDFAGMLVGDTKEEVMKCAKKLREGIDAQAILLAKGNIEPPPDPHGKPSPTAISQAAKDDQTRNVLKNALGLGVVQQIH